MTITVKGKMEKGLIRLPKGMYFPDGTQVIVRIEPLLKTREKQEVISELCGAWSNDPTIIPIFEEIEQERRHYFGRFAREVSFK